MNLPLRVSPSGPLVNLLPYLLNAGTIQVRRVWNNAAHPFSPVAVSAGGSPPGFTVSEVLVPYTAAEHELRLQLYYLVWWSLQVEEKPDEGGYPSILNGWISRHSVLEPSVTPINPWQMQIIGTDQGNTSAFYSQASQSILLPPSIHDFDGPEVGDTNRIILSVAAPDGGEADAVVPAYQSSITVIELLGDAARFDGPNLVPTVT